MIDFEEYKSCARMGGSNSLAREEEDQNADEDIRATIVQNVSYFIFIDW